MLCRMMKDFLCKPGSGCCTNDLNQFAMATPRGATESVWIVCFGNKRVQTNQVNAKSFKMSCISLIKFPKSKQTEPTETQLKRQVNSAGQKLNFHLRALAAEYEQPSHYQTGSCSSSHGQWQMTCVEKQINWFLKTASAFWQLRQQTVVTEPATGESSVLRLPCDSLY